MQRAREQLYKRREHEVEHVVEHVERVESK